jgi:hypothetical protein
MSTRSAALASVVLAAALSGCAEPGRPSGEVTTAFEHRALEVDEAWRSLLRSQDAQAWRTGIVPLEDLTIPPTEGFDSKTSFAFAQGWYHASVSLPSSQPGPATVTFPDGATATVALDSASAVYGRIDKGDPPCQGGSATQPPPGSPQSATPSPGSPLPGAEGVTGAPAEPVCAVLTVTGATLGTTTLRTSRGAATVPAWLFSVAELPAPIARVALRPTELSPMPKPVIQPMGADSQGLVSAIRLTAARDQTVSFTIGVGACSRNPRGLGYETSEAVVIAGRAENSQGPCVASMALQPVTVTLISPIGDRVVLNAFDGQPMAVARSGPG